jgi:hypothetical protein
MHSSLSSKQRHAVQDRARDRDQARSRPVRRTALALAAAAALGPMAVAPASAASCTWNTTNGNWNAIVNWTACATGNGNPAGAPGAADSATIGSTGVVAVTTGQSINALSNAGTVSIASGGSLLLNAGGGGTVNSGTINVASGGTLTFDGRSFAHAISGGGNFVLAGGTLRMEGANTTTMAAGTAIRGYGNVGTAGLQGGAMSFVNNGTFSADTNGASLVLNAPATSGSYTNNSLFEARNGGTLVLNASVSQGGSGVLQALNGSTVSLNGVVVSGGTVTTAGTGVIQASNNQANLLSNVTLSGVVDLASATSQLRVGNNLALNGGTINVGASTLYFDNRDNQGQAATQSVTGTGTITLAGGGIRMEANNPAQTTIASGVSIAGWGTLGSASIQSGQYTLINNGLISANSSGNTLALQAMANGSQPVQNNGILEATGGGTLRLDTSVIGASGSQLRAGAGSTILINGVTVSGAVNTTGTGTLTASNNSANLLSNVTLNGVIDLSVATSQLRVGNNLTLQAGSSIRVGASTLYIDNRDNLGLAVNQSLSGSGSITVAGGNIRFETNNPSQTTIASGVSISGYGNLGQASLQSGQHTLINNGLISANSSGNTLVLQAIANGSQPVQNNGILEATGGGTLRLDTSVVGASGSQLRAGAGSTIVMNGVTVSGAVNTTGSGTVTASNATANLLSNVTLNGVIDLSGATAQLRVGNNLVLQNNASIAVGGSTLYLDNRDNVGLNVSQSITGSGSITLAGGSVRMEVNNPATTTLGAGVSISGYGTVGQPGLQGGNYSFINQGTVSANTSSQTLQIVTPGNSGSFNNQALLEARNGGTLQLSGSINQTAAGSVQALNGSTVQINGVTVSGGTLSTSGTGAIRASNSSANTLSNVTLAGVVDLASATSQLRVANGLSFSGGSINVGASTLYLDNRDNAGLAVNQTLSGTGTITLAGGGIRMDANNPAQTTFASGVTISGWGTIGQPAFQGGQYAVVNNGTIVANTAGQTLSLVPFANVGGLSGSGTLQVAGGTLSLATGQASTQGTLAIGAAGTLATNNQNLTLNTDYTNVQAGSGNSFVRRAGVTGTGQILAGGNAAMNITGAQVTGGNTGNATLTIGNVRVGGTTFNYQLANVGTTGPTLRGAIQTSVNGGNLTDTRLSGVGVTAGNFSTGAVGSNSGNLGVTFTVASAGPLAALSGQVLNLRSNFDNIADQKLNIALASGSAAYNAAVGSATPTPIAFAAQRVGGTLSQVLTVANTAPSGAFSEDLNASFSGFTGAASGSGSIAGRLAGSNNTGTGTMSVALDTSTSGNKAGTATLSYATAGAVNGVSNGLGVASAGSQTINVSGNVYAPAVPVLNTTTVNFGTVRVGDTITAQGVSVSNTASGALTDTLRATLAGGASPFSTTGTVSGLAAGGTNASSLTVGLNTSTAGNFSSNGTVTFTSQNPEMADLARGTGNVALLATVNNIAAPLLAKTSGAGSFSGSGTSYTLNFGTLIQGGGVVSSLLSLANSAGGPADALAGSFVLSALAGTPFSALSGFGSFSNVAGGSSLPGGLSLGFNTSTVGNFSSTITLNPRSTNLSQADLTLGAITLTLQGNVAAVPEPGTWALWLAGLAVLGGLARRQAAMRRG